MSRTSMGVTSLTGPAFCPDGRKHLGIGNKVPVHSNWNVDRRPPFARRSALQDLAERAGMSRSTFAQRFRETVGETPMEYLTSWRMLLPGDRLLNSRDALADTAVSLGYDSESAFSTAFKRVMGTSPRHYARRGAALA